MRRHARVFMLAALLAAPVGAQAKESFVYVHDSGDGNNRIYAFLLLPFGELSPVAGSPFTGDLTETGCGGFCQTLSWSKKRGALVAAGGNGLQAFLVQPGGALVAADPLLPDGFTGPYLGNESVDLGKKTFVYANDYDADALSTFELAEDGSLAAVLGGEHPTGGNSPDGMVVAKRKVLLSINEEGSIASFKIGRDGSLTAAPGSPLAIAAGSAWNLHLGRSARYVYVGDAAAPGIHGFRIDFRTGSLAVLPGSPFAVGDSENGISFPLGRSGPGFTLPGELPPDVSAQAVKTGKQGALETLGGAQLLTGQGGMQAHARTRNGKIFLVADNVTLRTYTVAKDGTLTFVDSLPAPGDVNDIVVVER